MCVMQVQSVLASVDVQEFNLKALMKQLGAQRDIHTQQHVLLYVVRFDVLFSN